MARKPQPKSFHQEEAAFILDTLSGKLTLSSFNDDWAVFARYAKMQANFAKADGYSELADVMQAAANRATRKARVKNPAKRKKNPAPALKNPAQKSFAVGDRVEIHPSLLRHTRGAKVGTVIGLSSTPGDAVRVKFDGRGDEVFGGPVESFKKVKTGARKKNPASMRGDPDKEAARELLIYADNEMTLYPQKQSILLNLLRKMRKGTYDPNKAVKLWQYWIDEAAKRYAKFHSSIEWHKQFDLPTRYYAAVEVTHEEGANLKDGAYDYLLPARTKNSRKKNPAPAFVIYAQKSGKRMVFDGTKFSERRPKFFGTQASAVKAGTDMVKRYPILKDYRVWIDQYRPKS